MTGFASEWLDLREAADTEARDGALLRRAAETTARRPGRPIVDLGCGTGSTARAMAGVLSPGTRWRLVDHDPALLALAAERVGERAETVVADLAGFADLPIAGAALVTASALFDLVSRDWVQRFARTLGATKTPLYAALTYDGRTDWTPTHPFDAAILAAFNCHQRSDKGFGAALGPDAPTALAEACRAVGYAVETATSDWRLGPERAALAREHARGLATAAIDAGHEAEDAAAWLDFRLEAAANGNTTVGHVDLFASARE